MGARVCYRLCGVVLVAVVGCSDRAVKPAPAATAPPPRLRVPNGRATIIAVQRTTGPLPGSNGQVRLTVADITGGQVMVSISTSEGEAIVDTISIRQSDKVSFSVDRKHFTLILEELRNALVGDDLAEFTLIETPAVPGPALSEEDKIRLLIRSIRDLDGAVFIRNGEEHESAAAAEHLRKKWKWKSKQIATVGDFIRIVATKSSTTGQPYVIRLPDGQEIESARFLREQLAKREHAQ